MYYFGYKLGNQDNESAIEGWCCLDLCVHHGCHWYFPRFCQYLGGSGSTGKPILNSAATTIIWH